MYQVLFAIFTYETLVCHSLLYDIMFFKVHSIKGQILRRTNATRAKVILLSVFSVLLKQSPLVHAGCA